MQRQSSVSTDARTFYPECTFCQTTVTAHLVMKETPNFRIIADHAPLLAGHTLIIPKQHYACYGEMSATLDIELMSLKHEVTRFLKRYYAHPAYWEHGVFHQSVFHAHLHCFPIGATIYSGKEIELGQAISSQEDIRRWYSQHGHYFDLEDAHAAFLFPPDENVYAEIVTKFLAPAVATHSTFTSWRTPQQRQMDGKPLIAALLHHWQEFQQEEKNNPRT